MIFLLERFFGIQKNPKKFSLSIKLLVLSHAITLYISKPRSNKKIVPFLKRLNKGMSREIIYSCINVFPRTYHDIIAKMLQIAHSEQISSR